MAFLDHFAMGNVSVKLNHIVESASSPIRMPRSNSMDDVSPASSSISLHYPARQAAIPTALAAPPASSPTKSSGLSGLFQSLKPKRKDRIGQESPGGSHPIAVFPTSSARDEDRHYVRDRDRPKPSQSLDLDLPFVELGLHINGSFFGTRMNLSTMEETRPETREHASLSRPEEKQPRPMLSPPSKPAMIRPSPSRSSRAQFGTSSQPKRVNPSVNPRGSPPSQSSSSTTFSAAKLVKPLITAASSAIIPSIQTHPPPLPPPIRSSGAVQTLQLVRTHSSDSLKRVSSGKTITSPVNNSLGMADPRRIMFDVGSAPHPHPHDADRESGEETPREREPVQLSVASFKLPFKEIRENLGKSALGTPVVVIHRSRERDRELERLPQTHAHFPVPPLGVSVALRKSEARSRSPTGSSKRGRKRDRTGSGDTLSLEVDSSASQGKPRRKLSLNALLHPRSGSPGTTLPLSSLASAAVAAGKPYLERNGSRPRSSTDSDYRRRQSSVGGEVTRPSSPADSMFTMQTTSTRPTTYAPSMASASVVNLNVFAQSPMVKGYQDLCDEPDPMSDSDDLSDDGDERFYRPDLSRLSYVPSFDREDIEMSDEYAPTATSSSSSSAASDAALTPKIGRHGLPSPTPTPSSPMSASVRGSTPSSTASPQPVSARPATFNDPSSRSPSIPPDKPISLPRIDEHSLGGAPALSPRLRDLTLRMPPLPPISALHESLDSATRKLQRDGQRCHRVETARQPRRGPPRIPHLGLGPGLFEDYEREVRAYNGTTHSFGAGWADPYLAAISASGFAQSPFAGIYGPGNGYLNSGFDDGPDAGQTTPPLAEAPAGIDYASLPAGGRGGGGPTATMPRNAMPTAPMPVPHQGTGGYFPNDTPSYAELGRRDSAMSVSPSTPYGAEYASSFGSGSSGQFGSPANGPGEMSFGFPGSASQGHYGSLYSAGGLRSPYANLNMNPNIPFVPSQQPPRSSSSYSFEQQQQQQQQQRQFYGATLAPQMQHQISINTQHAQSRSQMSSASHSPLSPLSAGGTSSYQSASCSKESDFNADAYGLARYAEQTMTLNSGVHNANMGSDGSPAGSQSSLTAVSLSSRSDVEAGAASATALGFPPPAQVFGLGGTMGFGSLSNRWDVIDGAVKREPSEERLTLPPLPTHGQTTNITRPPVAQQSKAGRKKSAINAAGRSRGTKRKSPDSGSSDQQPAPLAATELHASLSPLSSLSASPGPSDEDGDGYSAIGGSRPMAGRKNGKELIPGSGNDMGGMFRVMDAGALGVLASSTDRPDISAGRIGLNLVPRPPHPRPPVAHDADGSQASGKRKLECHFCGKMFERASVLKTHINCHTGAKPYCCTVDGCDATFGVLSNMYRHVRSHTQPRSAGKNGSSKKRNKPVAVSAAAVRAVTSPGPDADADGDGEMVDI